MHVGRDVHVTSEGLGVASVVYVTVGPYWGYRDHADVREGGQGG